ncbi:damage-control phosphatase ARMT1 family protein [Lamprocystis purpurea]|uniref:damage-control phosphatase ARMT1 family protein n=1 Tax=Lamprocystis purpurea TaxID=61598 RepID=UPI0003790966|nr:ARMT1-like domain-containing protein [Lamprocystis purpurea]
MKTYLDCYPCFLRQALSAARRAQATVEQQRQILLDTMDLLQALSPQATPPVMAERIHRMVRARTNTPDPYRQSKQDATAQALGLLPELRDRVRTASDPLETAVRIAIAGNIIDDGAAEQYDLQATLARVLEQPFAIDGLPQLRQALSTVDAVLYLADNAGETVFDRVLIETIDRPVTYAVKAGPIINDATLEDALAAGLDAVSTLIDTGSDAPGTLLDRCSPAFRAHFAQAPLIIAKGQANYETLSDIRAPVFFLLQAKCRIIADDLGVPVAGVVLKAPADMRRWNSDLGVEKQP